MRDQIKLIRKIHLVKEYIDPWTLLLIFSVKRMKHVAHQSALVPFLIYYLHFKSISGNKLLIILNFIITYSTSLSLSLSHDSLIYNSHIEYQRGLSFALRREQTIIVIKTYFTPNYHLFRQEHTKFYMRQFHNWLKAYDWSHILSWLITSMYLFPRQIIWEYIWSQNLTKDTFSFF